MGKNLKLRIVTALIGAPVILWLLFGFGVEGVSLVAWVISSGMWFEFARMFFKLQDRNEKTAIVLVLNAIVHWGHYWLTVGVHPAILGLAPILVLSVVFLLQVPRLLNYRGPLELNTAEGVATLRQHFSELTAACFGVVYCTWCPLLMVNIRQVEEGHHWLAFTLLTVWSADTFAYFAGSAFGKTPLFPSVSPKKSWEGVIGGILGAIAVTQGYAHYYLDGTSKTVLVVMCLTLALASVLGDLVESLMKRAMECKDSGSLLPGHGGFLDRFDGVVFALPVMYLYLWMFL
jgi:CDP-diglyceride synthetase